MSPASSAETGQSIPAGRKFRDDTVGLGRTADGLRAMGIDPAPLLVEKAASGGGFTRG
jgi:hypothetical protein